MKKFFITSLLLLVTLAGNSQKVYGTFSLPTDEKFLSVKWDWSKALIDNKFNEQEWITVVGDNVWEDAKKEAMLLITREMNDKLDNSRIMVISPESDKKTAYTLYITPVKYNKKGFNDSYYILIDNNTENQIGMCKISGRGGVVGSIGNLLGDGYEEAAANMGNILRRYNKLKRQ